MVCLLPYVLPFIVWLAVRFQRRAGALSGTDAGVTRGTLHAVFVSALAVTCPYAFALTCPYDGTWSTLGLAVGAVLTCGSFTAALILADKAVDFGLGGFLSIGQLARLEIPDAAGFSALILGWVAIRLGRGDT